MRRLSTVRNDVHTAAADLESLAADLDLRAAGQHLDGDLEAASRMRAESNRLRSLAGGLAQIGYGL